MNSALARLLVDSQFPQWRSLPLRRLEPAGSDHVIYRLGDELTVRLPRHSGAIGQAAKELLARSLAGFLRALQGLEVPPDAAPGRPLAGRDRDTRAAIASLAGVFDAAALTRVWDEALAAPPWERPPVWFHGDFHTGNLLTEEGRLSAVIDFGGLGAGDPTTDLQVAFTLLDPGPRAAFRAALDVDEATWTRARGWALTGGLIAYRAYAATDSRVAAQTTRQISAALNSA